MRLIGAELTRSPSQISRGQQRAVDPAVDCDGEG